MSLNSFDLSQNILQALQKKKMIAAGKLGKHGKPNENTPQEWLKENPDLTYDNLLIKIYFLFWFSVHKAD